MSRKLLAACSLAVVALAGCVGGPPRPTTPTYSGAERPDPTRPPRPGDPAPRDPVSTRYAESRNAYMPRHIPRDDRRELMRIAVLLPFSSSNPEVAKLARGLFNAAQLALFEVGADNVILIPKDTGDTQDGAKANEAARDAIRDGSVAVIGPLFASHVPIVARDAQEVRAPVLAFSTDVSAIGQGAYLVSLTPTTEVERIVEWASTQGITRYALFSPNSPYGHTVETALRQEAARRGGLVISAEFYNPNDNSPQEPARRLSQAVKRENTASPGKVAVLIPERGVQLRTVAALLAYLDVNQRSVKVLGTGAWNDPSVWREPALYGGAFPAPDPASMAAFEKLYQDTFGEPAPQLASYGYDAGYLAAKLGQLNRLDAGMLQREEGWTGINGLFRFRPDGGVERALAVLQLQDGGVKIVSPPLKAFGPGS
jgi:ABC-type branched-subunit amino acid transport system substrate-binding protein